MEIIKPEPLVIAGRAHYTLSSYEPVSIELDSPSISEEDVDYALQMTIMQAGGGPERLSDDAWIRDKFEGIHGADELRAAVRSDMQLMNSRLLEQQKATACAEQLAQRLQQRVPQEAVAQARQGIEQAFFMSLAQQGISEQLFLSQSGMQRGDLDAMLDQQAHDAAEQEAATNAWADKFDIRVSDEELPELLGIDPAKTDEFMRQLSGAGQLEEVRNSARHIKALRQVVAECSCTYHHGNNQGGGSSHSHLKLV